MAAIFRLAGLSANHPIQVQVPADAVGVTDSVGVTAARVPSVADAVGVTDSVATVLAVAQARTPVDAVGVTDAVSVAWALTAAPVDAVGVTDAFSRTQVFIPVFRLAGLAAKPSQLPPVLFRLAGLAAVPTPLYGTFNTPADAVGVTDSFTAVRSGSVSAADGVGVTDSFTAVIPVAAWLRLSGLAAMAVQEWPIWDGSEWLYRGDVRDVVAVTDAFTVVRAKGHVPVEIVGVLDSLTTVFVADRVFSDPVGVFDSVSAGITATNVYFIADDVSAAGDLMVAVWGLARSGVDVVAVTDAFDVTRALGVVNDVVAVTDEFVHVRTVVTTVRVRGFIQGGVEVAGVRLRGQIQGGVEVAPPVLRVSV